MAKPRSAGSKRDATRSDKASTRAAERDGTAPGDRMPPVDQNLRRIRAARGLSLERLAQMSGVSRAMLGQIELGQSTPTIGVLWKVARALDLPFSALLGSEREESTVVLPRKRAWVLASEDGSFRSRALFPMDRPRHVELYELSLAPGAREDAEPHAPSTTENLVVTSGEVDIVVAGETHRLDAGDAIQFRADVPHAYVNVGVAEARLVLVMTYAEQHLPTLRGGA